jgi:hypothetical protein
MATETQRRNHANADAKVEAAVEQTFPASDPPGNASTQGTRAVPAERMMHPEGGRPTLGAGSVTLDLRFPDSEAAKLALEAAVREGPMDRRCATIDLDDDRVTMRLEVPEADAGRLDALLRKHGATDS